jgi:F-type H+-transporting ATPase subunit a
MIDVAPHVMFSVFGIAVRDTVVATWIMIAITVGVVLLLRRSRPMALELLVDFVLDLLSPTLGDRAAAYLPFLGTLTIFIAIANVIGVVPVVITPTRDINTPLAMALVVFFSVHYFGIRERGPLGYLKQLATPVFILPLEIVSQISRTVSLTIRLFGNIISTELVVAVIFSLVPIFAPLPLIGFSLLTGVLQAYIFAALAVSYIGSGLEEI